MAHGDYIYTKKAVDEAYQLGYLEGSQQLVTADKKLSTPRLPASILDKVPEGCYITFQYTRKPEPSKEPTAITAFITKGKGKSRVVLAQATAKCSKKDQFVKRVGRVMSAGRAIQKLLEYIRKDEDYVNQKSGG